MSLTTCQTNAKKYYLCMTENQGDRKLTTLDVCGPCDKLKKSVLETCQFKGFEFNNNLSSEGYGYEYYAGTYAFVFCTNDNGKYCIDKRDMEYSTFPEFECSSCGKQLFKAFVDSPNARYDYNTSKQFSDLGYKYTNHEKCSSIGFGASVHVDIITIVLLMLFALK